MWTRIFGLWLWGRPAPLHSNCYADGNNYDDGDDNAEEDDNDNHDSDDDNGDHCRGDDDEYLQ